MEAQGCSPQWKRKSSQSSRSSGQAVRDSAGSHGPQKNVTVAPTSRLLTDRQYRMRRPLFTAQHTSILKKTQAEASTEQEQKHSGTGTEDHTMEEMGAWTRPREEQRSPHSEPRLSLRTRPREEQPDHSELSPPGYGSRTSPLLGCRPLSRSPPSSVLQVHRLNTPARPRLSSPVLYPTYTPLSTHRRTQTSPKQNTWSQYQAEYWACAIPKDPPPTQSGGDPRHDYEALLDYTYPLRPGLRIGRDRPQPGDLNHTDWTLQDSGIELDHLSTGLSELNLSLSGMEQDKNRFCLGQRSPDLMESPFPRTPLSPAECVLPLDSLEWSKPKNSVVFPSSAALITLPRDRGLQRVRGDSEEEDEEFRPLPEQLEQLQHLSQQVREAAARLGSAHWDPPLSVCPSVGQDTADTGDADFRADDMAHLRTEDAVDSHRGPEQHGSLMEHINVFCCHLEQLVRWLYAASQKIELLAPPTVDIHSVKSSLAQYQSFQRDVNSHMPLTSSVLQTGHLLLSCIHSTSPVLRDTLLLIESQSRLLERHTEHFFSTILSAMDSLTQPPSQSAPDLHSGPQMGSEKGGKSRAQSGAGEQGAVEVQTGVH